jgi:hypothetical protein
MAKAKVLKPKKTQDEMSYDSYSQKEAQTRFERAVDVAITTQPLHREPPQKRRPK